MARALDFDILSFAYAHRGLWDASIPENSLAAFASASAAGVGAELDVRPLKCGALIVHHDPTLLRLCGDPRRLEDLTLDEVRELKLADGSAPPELRQALAAMGEAPTLIELKIDPTTQGLAERVADAVKDYKGRCALMSFDEATVASLRAAAPDRPVGQLIDASPKATTDVFEAQLARARDQGVDFLGPAASLLELIAVSKPAVPLVVWTIRDLGGLARARHWGAAPIFEGFSAALALQRGKPVY